MGGGGGQTNCTNTESVFPGKYDKRSDLNMAIKQSSVKK